MIIGEIKSDNWHAVLRKNGVWSSSNKDVEKILNNQFSPKIDYSPALGDYGIWHLHEAAKELGAKVTNQMKIINNPERLVY